MQLIIAKVLLVLVGMMLVTLLLNRRLGSWACRAMGWHFVECIAGFDGCSMTAHCARCGKAVLRDGQGDWF